MRSGGWVASGSVGSVSGFRDRSCFNSLLWVCLLSCEGGRGGVAFEECFPFESTDDILRKARCGAPRAMFRNGEE